LHLKLDVDVFVIGQLSQGVQLATYLADFGFDVIHLQINKLCVLVELLVVGYSTH